MSSIQLFEAVHFKTDCNLESRDRIQKEKVYCMKKVNVCFFFCFLLVDTSIVTFLATEKLEYQ